VRCPQNRVTLLRRHPTYPPFLPCFYPLNLSLKCSFVGHNSGTQSPTLTADGDLLSCTLAPAAIRATAQLCGEQRVLVHNGCNLRHNGHIKVCSDDAAMKERLLGVWSKIMWKAGNSNAYLNFQIFKYAKTHYISLISMNGPKRMQTCSKNDLVS
jgi:hypothetical protein